MNERLKAYAKRFVQFVADEADKEAERQYLLFRTGEKLVYLGDAIGHAGTERHEAVRTKTHRHMRTGAFWQWVASWGAPPEPTPSVYNKPSPRSWLDGIVDDQVDASSYAMRTLLDRPTFYPSVRTYRIDLSGHPTDLHDAEEEPEDEDDDAEPAQLCAENPAHPDDTVHEASFPDAPVIPTAPLVVVCADRPDDGPPEVGDEVEIIDMRRAVDNHGYDESLGSKRTVNYYTRDGGSGEPWAQLSPRDGDRSWCPCKLMIVTKRNGGKSGAPAELPPPEAMRGASVTPEPTGWPDHYSAPSIVGAQD